MDVGTESGRFVWHDLLTNDVAGARRFYSELLGWDYEVEHAMDFTWKPGEESDYPLIVVNGQAHGGFVDPGYEVAPHWLPWVAVEDVDAVTAGATRLGATIDREPWDTPGVGRGSVLRDPLGAKFCPHTPTHDFPAPEGTFRWDAIVADDIEDVVTYYRALLGWGIHETEPGRTGGHAVFTRAGDAPTAGAMPRPFGGRGPAAWIPYLSTDEVDATITRAVGLGAVRVSSRRERGSPTSGRRSYGRHPEH